MYVTFDIPDILCGLACFFLFPTQHLMTMTQLLKFDVPKVITSFFLILYIAFFKIFFPG